jgi:hypothetical protein
VKYGGTNKWWSAWGLGEAAAVAAAGEREAARAAPAAAARGARSRTRLAWRSKRSAPRTSLALPLCPQAVRLISVSFALSLLSLSPPRSSVPGGAD